MARLLLDTHTFLWWLNDSPVQPSARDAIANPRNDIFVSAVSAWEVSIKQSLGKLTAPSDVGEQIPANGFQPLPISVAHGLAAGALPPHHSDPFDRMLIAQAKLEQLTVVTRDHRFSSYGISVLDA